MPKFPLKGQFEKFFKGATEAEVLRTIRQLPTALRLNPGLLERYLARDGTPALMETLQGRAKMARACGPQLLPMMRGLGDSLHKWPAVEEILAGHDFQKAIIFVERTLIARLLRERLSNHNPVLLMGRGRAGIGQAEALLQAQRDDCRVVIGTSAAEEGVNLPSADLLIVWGNVASETRFIQRHGRIMRLAPEVSAFTLLERLGQKPGRGGLKFAAFIVTPETADYDSFVRGLETAVVNRVVDMEKTFGWDPEVLWPRTTWWHVSEDLRGNPKPLADMEQVLQVRGSVVDRVIGPAVRRGRVFYLYDVARIATDIVGRYLDWDADRPLSSPVGAAMRSLQREFEDMPDPIGLARRLALLFSTLDKESHDALYELWRDRRLKKFSVKAPINPEQQRARRIYLLAEDAPQALILLPQQLSTAPVSYPLGALVSPIERGRRGGLRKEPMIGLRWGWAGPAHHPAKLFARMSEEWHASYVGYSIGLRPRALDFYFRPVSVDVLADLLVELGDQGLLAFVLLPGAVLKELRRPFYQGLLPHLDSTGMNFKATG